MEQLFALFNSIKPLSSGLERYLPTILRRFSYKKEEPILQVGQICRKIAFIQSGLVRVILVNHGQEFTMQFMKEGEIFFEPDSFTEQIPSTKGIVAIEDCEILGIGYDDLEETYHKFPEFNFHMRVINARSLARSIQLNRMLTGDTPSEKYALLLQREPELFRRVPLAYMASYLDIDLETLNELRSNK
jgi:CRP/FNR family transcriptional regulator, anaerobic regulatory protein